jgi:predicted DNA-binding transcriptional regulator AlpA
MRDAQLQEAAMRLLTKKEAAALVRYHPASLMRLAREGLFPKPIKIGRGTQAYVRFDADEIEAWLASKAGEREAGAAKPASGLHV